MVYIASNISWIGEHRMKQTILEVLEENLNDYISGEEIAQRLNMTRANIWKEIQKLKNSGFEISSVRNLGYKLVDYQGNLSRSLILNNTFRLSAIEVFDTITSTNDYAKTKIHDNLLILANHQSKGKGRMQRDFFSPSKSGIYMSLVLVPKLEIMDVQLVTICAALAVCQALEKLYELQPKIKWLNDIYLGDQKVCGILSEGEIELETNSFRHIILGIGVNTNSVNDIPSELVSIYTALSQHTAEPINRNQLVIEIINNFYDFYDNLPTNRLKLIDMYKLRSNVLGKFVTIRNQGNETYLAKDISPEAHLIVVDKLGNELELNSGEISLGGL